MSLDVTTRPVSAAQRTVDRITVRALRHAFDPHFDPEEAGLDLAQLAGSGPVLRAAQSRVRHAVDSQWSDVADRAREALDHAVRAVGSQDRGAPLPQPVPVELVDDVLRRLSVAALDLRTRATGRARPEVDGVLVLIDGIVADLQRAALEDAMGARAGTVVVPRQLVGRIVEVELVIGRLLQTSPGEGPTRETEALVGLARAVQVLRRASAWR